MTASIGGAGARLDPTEVRRFVADRLAGLDLDGRSLCLVVPDLTRKCPLPMLMAAVHEAVVDRVRSCTVVVALGTHAPLAPEALARLVGPEMIAGPAEVVNHRWWEAATFVTVGELTSDLVEELSGGRLAQAVSVRVNRLVVDSDVTIIVGPVQPHEVVGFSGGNKYLFPGLSGPEMIDLTHWLGALITSAEIIGTPGITPVRALIDAATQLVPGARHVLAVVVDDTSGDLESASFGEPGQAWSASAEVAATSHVRYLPRPVRRVLSMVPSRYDDLWTGAKGLYKVEPAVADGGEVVLFAPHITTIATTHPNLDEVGYHCRDYFLANWDRYRHYPWGELAHSTHLYGAGTYDPATGLETPRVRVTLAMGIPEAVVRRANLGYLDPATIDVDAWRNDGDALVVPDAGEVLYRVTPG